MQSADAPILGSAGRKSRARASNVLRIPTWMLRSHTIAPVWSSRACESYATNTGWHPSTDWVSPSLTDTASGPSVLPEQPSGNFGMASFGDVSPSQASQQKKFPSNVGNSLSSDPMIRRVSGVLSIDQARLIFSVFSVAKDVEGDLVFQPSDVFRFYNGQASSGSNLRQLEYALASLCDVQVAHQNLPGIGKGSGPIISQMDSGRLSLSFRNIKKGESAKDRLCRAISSSHPRRRRYWRIRLTDVGNLLVREAHFTRVDNHELSQLPRSPIARWLHLWLMSHGGGNGTVLPHRLSRIAAHAGFTEPSYESRYASGSDAGKTIRSFNRVLRKIERYIPRACSNPKLCGWTLAGAGSEPVLHVLKLPSSLERYWQRVAERFSPATALSLLCRYGDKAGTPDYPSHGPAEAGVRSWVSNARRVAKRLSGPGATPSDLLKLANTPHFSLSSSLE